MKFFIALFVMASLYACQKKDVRLSPIVTNSQIEMTCGTDKLLSQVSQEPNSIGHYQFGGRAGNYFGLTADFPVIPSGTLQLRFGNVLTGDYFLTEENIRRLLGTGKKSMGSLGAFTSFATLVEGAAEIAYTDEAGHRWCTTILNEYYENGRLRTKASLPDDAGYIQIDTAIIKESTQGLNPSFWIKGVVKTKLHEVNGPGHKMLTGSFSGIVGIE